MRKLRISPDFSLPLDLVIQRTSILGRTRSGKSHTAGVIVEEVLKARQQVVVMDPKGDWHGLRSSADGNSPGLPITIMGGKHGDIPLEATAGVLVADVVVNERISAVLDLSLFDSKADEIRFATAFLDRLYRKNTEPILLVIDESDTFAPQRPEKNETVMLNRMETICRRGAGKGIGVILISQRSASIHKGCLSQTELLIAHQTTAPQDKKAIEGWVVDHGDEERRDAFMKRVPKLPIGTAIIWSPSWLDVYKEAAIREKETYDSSAAPRIGQRRRPPKVLARVDLERLKKHMAATIQKMRNEDPRLLREEVARLRDELQRAQAATKAGPPGPPPAKEARPSVQVKEVRVDVPALKKTDIRAVTRLVSRMEKAREGLGWSVQSLEIAANSLSRQLSRATDMIEATGRRPRHPETTAKTILIPSKEGRKAIVKNVRQVPVSAGPDADGKALVGGERRMLEILAKFHPGFRTKAQLAQLSGYTMSGGTFGNYFGTLRREKYVIERADGGIEITEKGLSFFGGRVPQGPRNPEELLAMWRENLLAGERKMLDALIEAYPKALSREDLGARTGYEATGGTFGNYLGTLRRNGLAVVEGETVLAHGSLFEVH